MEALLILPCSAGSFVLRISQGMVGPDRNVLLVETYQDVKYDKIYRNEKYVQKLSEKYTKM